jgi:hypothetical protein
MNHLAYRSPPGMANFDASSRKGCVVRDNFTRLSVR